MALDEESPLVDNPIQSLNQTLNHSRDIHILSWAFLLIFLAYGAAQNLQSTLNTDGDLGTISLGILYTSFTVSSLFASSVVRKFGTKNALLLSTTGYWLYIAANLIPSWYTLVPASLYLGFAAAILWVAEGTYLTSTARSQANDHKLHEGTVIGHFNGEFWGIFACHQVVGNLLTLALLKDGTEGTTSGTTLLFTVFLGSMTLGTVLMSFLKKRDGEETEGERDSSLGFYTFLVSLWKQVIIPLCDMRLLLIVPLIAYSGLQQAFVWAEFTKYYVQPSLGESGVGGAMAVYGAFDAICSLAVGRFTSGVTSITFIVSGGAFLQGGILIWLLKYSEPTGVLRILYPLIIAAVLGIGNGVLMTQLNALLAMLFKHDMGFIQSKSDTSLFIYHQGPDTAYLLLYVDDIILTTSSDALRRRLMTSLSVEFAMKDLGPLSHFLGISVARTGDSLFLSQQTYARDIIHRAAMDSCKPVATPVDTGPKLGATGSAPFHDPTTYRSLAGALQYLTFTRPDISYAVQHICMHMHSPTDDHWNALKRVIRYIQGTTDYGLSLTPAPNLSLRAYTDADWAGCPDTRRSTSGYCVYLGDNLLSWSSKRQPTVSRSSAEAEYRGVANVVSEICWLRNLLVELHQPLLKATLIYCDNVSAIYLSRNPVQHQRTKHIELDIHFVREQVQRGCVRVLHVPSRYQVADIFTKGLPRVLFNDFRSSLNVRQPPDSTAGV